jgi:hypothetical protein
LGFRFFFLYNLFFLLINFFSWLFTQGNLDLLPNPDKGPSTHSTMEPIKISRDGVYKLIKNIKPSKATGPDTIAGRGSFISISKIMFSIYRQYEFLISFWSLVLVF